MISSEMIECLNANKFLVDEAIEERAKGNRFGASCLIRQYETLVEEELDFWHVEWGYAFSLGLIEDVSSLH